MAMKITFILPAIGKRPGQRYLKSWQIMEPLTIATLKALTSAGYDTEFFDDRLELIDYATATDLIAISVETYTACRAYQIAARFRARGIPVVMGGYHATTMPEEVAQHADALVVGNAEEVWEGLLADAALGRLKNRYQGAVRYCDIVPDRSIYGKRKYSLLGLVETGRGCTFRCGFCSITSYYAGRYQPRSIATVVRDIQSSGKRYFFFIDDNVVADEGYAIALCKAVAPLGIKWSGQGSLTMAQNPELLYWLKKSGCDVLLIGLESLDENNLQQMNKTWNARMGDRDALISRIHAAGISIYATFVFGYDHDQPETFERAVAFAEKHGFYFAAFNHVTPFPATPLYENLKKQERLLTEKWWLDTSYRYGYLSFHPKLMTHEQLAEACRRARVRFFSPLSIARRLGQLLTRNRNPVLSYLFLSSNIMLRREVNLRMELPIGTGLDALPK